MSEVESWCPCGDSRETHRYLCGGKLHDDMDKLFASETGADCTFVLPEGEIKAHKNILSARVEVFERMFSSNCTESQTNRVNITDCDLPTFKAFLNYLYCGFLHQPFDPYNLLFLSSKYMVPELVCACVPPLRSKLKAFWERDDEKVVDDEKALAEKLMKLAKTRDIPMVTNVCEDALIERLELRKGVIFEDYLIQENLIEYAVELLILSHDLFGFKLKEKCLNVLNDPQCLFHPSRYPRLNAYPTLLAQLEY